MEFLSGQTLFLLATLVCVGVAFFIYRWFSKPTTNVLDELRASGVEREHYSFPWDDWEWEARDTYARRMEEAKAKDPSGAVPAPLGEEDQLKVDSSVATDGNFLPSERHIMLVKRAMTLMLRVPIFNEHRAKAVQLKEQGFLDDESWEVFLTTVGALNEEGKAIEEDIAALKIGQKYKETVFQQAQHYTAYTNAPSPRFSFVKWTWPERDTYKEACEAVKNEPKEVIALLTRRIAPYIRRVQEFQKQEPAVNELKLFTVIHDEDWQAYQHHGKILQGEGKSIEAEVTRINPSEEFKKYIFTEAQRLLMREQAEMQQKMVKEAESKKIAAKTVSPLPVAKSTDNGGSNKKDEAQRQRIARELIEEEERQQKKKDESELRKRHASKAKSPIVEDKVEPVGAMKVQSESSEESDDE